MKYYLPVFLVIIFSSLSYGQSSIPTLTTDDIVAPRAITSVDASVTKNLNNTDKPEAKAGVKSEPVKEAEDPKKIAAKDWNERLKKAQEKAKDLDRQVDQSELEINRLRNQLTSIEAKSPEARGQINDKIGMLAAQTQKLRGDAKTAQHLVDVLISEGNTNDYKIAEASLKNEKGEPDAKAHQEMQATTQTEINSAKLKIEVLELRLRDNQSEIIRNGNGDNFKLNRLRSEQAQIKEEIEKAKLKIEELSSKIASK